MPSDTSFGYIFCTCPTRLVDSTAALIAILYDHFIHFHRHFLRAHTAFPMADVKDPVVETNESIGAAAAVVGSSQLLKDYEAR